MCVQVKYTEFTKRTDLSNLFQFEILVCVQDELDPAVKIVRQLMEAYPLVNSRLFTGRLHNKHFCFMKGKIQDLFR